MDFYQNYKQNIDAISKCLEAGLIFPALTLIYSSIDVISWMAFGDINVEERFTNWIDRWMYKRRKLEASPIDLYAARCSVLHTLTPDSSLSKKGKANTVAYAWGNADLNHLIEVAEKRGIERQSFIHINELFELFTEGVNAFMAELDVDSNLREGFDERMAQSYENILNDEMQRYRE